MKKKHIYVFEQTKTETHDGILTWAWREPFPTTEKAQRWIVENGKAGSSYRVAMVTSDLLTIQEVVQRKLVVGTGNVQKVQFPEAEGAQQPA